MRCSVRCIALPHPSGLLPIHRSTWTSIRRRRPCEKTPTLSHNEGAGVCQVPSSPSSHQRNLTACTTTLQNVGVGAANTYGHLPRTRFYGINVLAQQPFMHTAVRAVRFSFLFALPYSIFNVPRSCFPHFTFFTSQDRPMLRTQICVPRRAVHLSYRVRL